jgi:hypothetical protein
VNVASLPCLGSRRHVAAKTGPDLRHEGRGVGCGMVHRLDLGTFAVVGQDHESLADHVEDRSPERGNVHSGDGRRRADRPPCAVRMLQYDHDSISRPEVDARRRHRRPRPGNQGASVPDDGERLSHALPVSG